MDKKLQKVIEIFRECTNKLQSLGFEDYKSSNKLVKKQNKAYKSISGDSNLIKEFYEILLNDDNIFVRKDAIIYCGNENYDRKLALKLLIKLNNDDSFSAYDKLGFEYAIKRWEEQLKD